MFRGCPRRGNRLVPRLTYHRARPVALLGMGRSRFLVLVSSSDERRVRSSLSAFADGDEAMTEFRRTEERLRAVGGWVELASVDDEGRLERLCRAGSQPREEHATSRSASSGAEPRWTCT